jgi:hypothetical protein
MNRINAISTMDVAPQQLAKAHLQYPLQSKRVFPHLGTFSFPFLQSQHQSEVLSFTSSNEQAIILILWIRKLPLFERTPFSGIAVLT